MGVKQYKITIEPTGEEFFCNDNQFILQAMQKAGCGPIHYGCFGGGCGVCKMRVFSGEFDIAKKMSKAHISDGEKSKGIVLICCVKPRSNITLGNCEQQ